MAEDSDHSDAVSGTMLAPEIIAILGRHGCPDITSNIDLSRCSSKPIAGGGFGDVYQGTLNDGSKVAIKCPRLYLDASDENRDVLKSAAREIYTWSKCKHAHVIELNGLAYFRGHLAMVSPWMAYGSLQQYLIRRPESDRCDLCTQIASGLAYLHSIDVVHGDVKGANVLVSGNGIAKLTDFGNTILKTHTLQFTGTSTASSFSLRWTAPEVLEGTSGHTRQADVYALGMTILEIISGKIPFHGRSDLVVFGDVVARRSLPLRPEVSIPSASRHGDSLWELLTLCWAYDPSTRPEAAHVLDELRTISREGLVELESPISSEFPWPAQNISTVQKPFTSLISSMLADRKKRSVRFPSTDDPGDHTLVGGHATASASPASFYGTPATHFTGSPPPMVVHHIIRPSGRVGSALSFGSLPRLLHIPDSKITSGVYTITNVTTGYCAILRGADLTSPLLTVSNELGAAKEWNIQLLEDGKYAIINEQHPLYVSCDPKIKQGGTVYGDPEEKHWHIKASEDNYYSIWTTELDRNMAPLSWGLDDVENNASIVLRTGAHGTNNQWRIRPVTT